MKFLIVDDHAIVRRGIKEILEQDFPGSSVVEVKSGSEACLLIDQGEYEIVILDINLPDKNGMDVLKEIKLKRASVPVIILSLYSEEQYALRAIKAGASSYLTKESAPEELVRAIQKVLQGGKYVSASVGEKLADNLAGEVSDTPHDRLSDRELEVLRLIGKGMQAGEIAEQLCLSVKTISTYRARILEKLNLRTTPELIRYVIDHHLEK
ncbi:response regulator transcription factor [Candidatus Nitronereus thalassa]|uniref:Response regulator transcription factor n=1 Tax=Candidatus Nitronereus thalassa TaxID=3020898 RepID=A0ABU3K788_9BACT|nr:response regulator transcription factor [Candidatus Nitronereus thalassa]MDT7042230.1 response regulator transcription factor [Candidatus Nitronereus thalassa]